MPEARFAPALLRASCTRPRSTSASSAQVVVLPFVAETSTQPRGSRAARRRGASGAERREHAARQGRAAAAAARARCERRRPGRGECEPHHRRVPSTRASLRCAAGRRHARVDTAYTRPRLQRVRDARRGRRRDAVVEGSRYSQIAGIDPERLDAFRAGIRKRYSDEQILARAARERGAPGPLAHDARVRGRRGDDRAPADRDRALRLLERGQAPRGPRAAPLRDPRGAARPAARAGRGARPHADGARPRDAARLDALQVALLAHLRLAHERAARGRLRRAGRRGAARPRDRAGRLPGRAQRPPAEVRRLGRGAPLGSEHAHRVAGLPHVRGAPRCLVDVPVPGPRAARQPGRRGRARRHARRRTQ